MAALLQGTTIFLSIILAFFWLSSPGLSTYSLQAFSISMLVYFVLKRMSKAKLWHLTPTVVHLEMPVVTFAFLLLIGSTGNFESLFYPFTFIHLFFLVFATETGTAIAVSMLIILFHYALSPSLTPAHISSLLTLPIVLIFFLFAKRQYTETIREQHIIDQDRSQLKSLSSKEHILERSLKDFIAPKVELLEQLAIYPTENRELIQGQIRVIKQEINRVLQKLGQSR